MRNYDPDKAPEIDAAAHAHAREMGLQAIHIICEEPNAKPGEELGVSFLCYSFAPPREGDRIELQDGTICEVEEVRWKVSKHPNYRMVLVVPNVFAVRISE